MQAFKEDAAFARCRQAFHVRTAVFPEAADELQFLADVPHWPRAAIRICLPVDTLLPRLLVEEQERKLPASLSQQVTCKGDLRRLLLEASAHRLCRGISASHYDAFVTHRQDIGKPLEYAQLLCGLDGERRFVHAKCEVLVSGLDTGGCHCAACSSMMSALSSAVCKWARKYDAPMPGAPLPPEGMAREQLLQLIDSIKKDAAAKQVELEGLQPLTQQQRQLLAQHEDSLQHQRRQMVEVQPAQHAALKVSEWAAGSCI